MVPFVQECKNQIQAIQCNKCKALYEKILKEKQSDPALGGGAERMKLEFIQAFENLKKIRQDLEKNVDRLTYKQRKIEIKGQCDALPVNDLLELLKAFESRPEAQPIIKKIRAALFIGT